jgi:glutamine synthetase
VQAAHLSEVVAGIDELQETSDALDAVLDEHLEGDSLSHAKHARDKIIPAMNAVRVAGDKLEGLVSDDLWPLPTYQEMLFLK